VAIGAGHSANGTAAVDRGAAAPVLHSVDLNAAVAAADCVVVCTDHSAYDWQDLAGRAGLIVDTRNALRHVAPSRAEIVRL
jgi:UDP-N-acetyl-D-glucosamine dehydrogenase